MNRTVSQHLRHGLIIALLILPLSVPEARPAQAQTGQICFRETYECIAGPIRAYWERNGGLPIFGYPILPQQPEEVEGQLLSVQLFERDRLEDHGAQGVMAGRLGAHFLELTERPWEYFDRAQETGAGCRRFEPTGHTLCEPFLSYWQRNGGLTRFGYPITEPFREVVEGGPLTVQYFERRRLEIHSELPGSPVLLGLLGREVLHNLGSPRFPECLNQTLPSLQKFLYMARFQGQPQGCPVLNSWESMAAATQQFERGEMLWLDRRNIWQAKGSASHPPQIFALSYPGPRLSLHDDTWRPGDPDTPDASPPREGLYAPWRGFGTAWLASPELRDRLGWAIEPQAQARTADVQLFRGALLVLIRETGRVYSFGQPFDPSMVRVAQP